MEIRRKNKKKRIHKYESEKVNKMNNILKLNVDDQQDDIKHLNEHLKEKALCVTCNPPIATRTKIIEKKYPRNHNQEKLL